MGQDKVVTQFLAAWRSGAMPHAWLLAGPRGVGKATFARTAVTRILAESAGPPIDGGGMTTPAEHPIARLVEAGSHPDLRWLERLPKERGEGLAPNISVDQIREAGEFLTLSPALSPWRAIVIDRADDLQASAANALLKMLEEPPASSLFLLVSNAPGRLLPTIRSRCRRLDFQRLADDAVASILAQSRPEIPEGERRRAAAAAAGSAGRAIAFAALDLAKLEAAALAILREGDPGNGRRSDLALELGRKGAAERYSAFLELVPALVAREAVTLDGARRARALDAYDKCRELAAIAPRLSLDPASTAFQIGSALASVTQHRLP